MGSWIQRQRYYLVRFKTTYAVNDVTALRDYEPRVTAYTDQLLDHFKQTEGKPVNVTDWFNFYSFDVMGDLAWGKSFGMLQAGVKHYFMNALHASMTNVGLFSHLVWLVPLFKATPILNRDDLVFWDWVNTQVKERKKVCHNMCIKKVRSQIV
jgi:cytochrome P450